MTGAKCREKEVPQQLLHETRVAAGLRQVDVVKSLGLPQPMVNKYKAVEMFDIRMGCADEILFGREVVTEMPRIMGAWVALATQRGGAGLPEA